MIFAHELRIDVGRRTVVNGVDLQIGTGIFGLLGRNGAGKTTLIRTLATALQITSGKLEILGVDLSKPAKQLPEIRRQIGYAPQAPLVLRHLSVSDQVAYAAWLKGLDTATTTKRVRQVLEQVDLADRSKDRTKNLSGGMLRRLGIAMALVAEPKVILLDEPTAGLDPEQRIAFRDLVCDLGRTRTVVLSTHLIEDVVTVCSSLVVLHDGRIAFTGDAESLAAHGNANESNRSAVESGFAAVTRTVNA